MASFGLVLFGFVWFRFANYSKPTKRDIRRLSFALLLHSTVVKMAHEGDKVFPC